MRTVYDRRKTIKVTALASDRRRRRTPERLSRLLLWKNYGMMERIRALTGPGNDNADKLSACRRWIFW
jgi:hypothetical protein